MRRLVTCRRDMKRARRKRLLIYLHAMRGARTSPVSFPDYEGNVDDAGCDYGRFILVLIYLDFMASGAAFDMRARDTARRM